MPKLTADLPKPFRMEGILREDDTPLHKACREAMINMIIHADFQGEGTLKVIKHRDCFEFTNPGTLKIPKEMIYKGGNSKARNPRMQTMLRMIGYGDTAGSGFPTILAAWAEKGWPEPDLEEDTILNQVTLTLRLGTNDGVESTSSSTPKTPPKGDDALRNVVLTLIRSNDTITKKEIAEKTGVTMYAVKKIISELREDGKAEFVGHSRNGKWIIHE